MSMLKRLVMPRAELAESSDEEMDEATAVPEEGKQKDLAGALLRVVVE